MPFKMLAKKELLKETPEKFEWYIRKAKNYFVSD
jgi:hypothetical protein